MKTHVVFDLDNTLVDTRAAKEYMKTREGRRFVAENIEKIETKITSPGIKKSLEEHHKKGQASIVTDAPEDYARAVLKKHGFPEDIPLFPVAQKPSGSGLIKAIEHHQSSPEKTIVIGDHPKDILDAHSRNVVSIGVGWGETCKIEDLQNAEAGKIIHNAEALEEILQSFERGELKHTSRQNPKKLSYLPKENYHGGSVVMVHKALGAYIPLRFGQSTQETSKILRFKNIKQLIFEELVAGKTDDFFYNGQLRRGKPYLDTFNELRNNAKPAVEELNLKGKTRVITAPNALPTYCYRTDVNSLFMHNVCLDLGSNFEEKREIFRAHPKQEDSLYGRSPEEEHLRTMGMYEPTFDGVENILFFDDVRTLGTQLNAMAKLVRHFGFKGKIYALTLGQTEQFTFVPVV